MVNYWRNKKRYIFIVLLLISNQFLSKGYTLNNRKLNIGESNSSSRKHSKSNSIFPFNQYKIISNNSFQKIKNDSSNKEYLLVENEILNKELEQTRNKDQNDTGKGNFDKIKKDSTNKENVLIQNEILNKELEQTKNKDQNDKDKGTFEKLNNESFYEYLKNKYIINIDKKNDGESSNYKERSNFEKIDNEFLNDYLKNNYKTNTNITGKSKTIDNKEKVRNKIPLPSQSEISTSEFEVPSRGYVRLIGPAITLNLEKADSFEILKLIGKLGNYGIVIVEEEDNKKEESINNPKITAKFDNANISDVFNSILLSSNMQAIVENNIIYVGKNILNKSLKSKVSKTYRLNQVNAASVADYLSTLGARISKVMLISGTIDGQEINDSLVNKKEFEDEFVNPYGIEKGPLFGLIGTADLRLQTITLIGSKDLMKTAEKYIKSLDIRHRQVALTIKMIDVSLTKSDIKNNVFEFATGATRIITNSGLGLLTSNLAPYNPSGGNVNNVVLDGGGAPRGTFLNWLEAKIANENAKILASPTLILGENPNIQSSGAAAVDDSLSAATIGRPFKNEGFIKVGESVITSFTQTQNEGGTTTCTGTEGTAGITFGAKLEKIDDNGYVTFALSPAISSVTKSEEITGCGIQNTLSVRKLDTGSIRVKNGDTLILSGVLQDSDSTSVSKVPILGDIPILGSLFRSNATQKRKSELIILVTPRILNDE